MIARPALLGLFALLASCHREPAFARDDAAASAPRTQHETPTAPVIAEVCAWDAGCDDKLELGAHSSSATLCASNHLADGVCCNEACDDGCRTCAKSKGAWADGTCSKTPFASTCVWHGRVCRTSDDCGPDYECANGRCACAAGQFYCPSQNLCLFDGDCCTTADCGPSPAPDSCHKSVECDGSHRCIHPSICANATQSCSDGICGCGPGKRICKNDGYCEPASQCCTSADCVTPPDACHTKSGAMCFASTCLYPLRKCSRGQLCSDGRCTASPIALDVTLARARYAYRPVAPPGDGVLRGFEAVARDLTITVTNLSSFPVAVHSWVGAGVRELDGVRLSSVKKNGVPVWPSTTFSFDGPGPLQREAVGKALVKQVLEPGEHVRGSFELRGRYDAAPYETFFEPDGPGRYSMRFVLSSDRGGPGPLLSNEVSFELR